MSWSSDVAEGALTLGTVLFKVTVGSTLKAMPVVKGSRLVSASSRRSGLQGSAIWDRGGPRGRVRLGSDRLSRHCRKDG